ncbi:MAG: type I polyketide synthase, partial [Exilibacterium sp.]
QLLVRDSQLFVPHLQRTVTDQGLVPAAETRHWRLDLATGADLEKRRLADCPELERPLNEGEIRIEVRAAGVNFYDLASILGLIEQEHELGSEAAGVVIDVGPGVNGFAVDDRVMAITEGAFSSSVIVEQRRAAKMPESWSFARAAGVPVVFLTVYHALVHIGKLRPGEKILIHAAAGGIGQAAIQLARYCGAELFVTAHPNKWQVLRDLGIDDDHIASSRDLEFVSQFRQVLGGGGIDLVLNSLTGEFIDGSMSLMGAGGRFIELGKTDIRDPEAVNAQYPGLSYHFIRRPDEDNDHVAKLFSALLPLFADNSLVPVPISAYGMRNAPAALRLMQQGRHTGKIVLTVPEPLGGEGTVMITGGTGALGSLLARHLVKECGARHLLLVSRSGLKAAGASQLQQDLEAEVASVTVAACDLSDFGAVQRLLETIPPEQPLAAVYHTAGILANATVANLTPEEFAPVFSSKVDTAWNLHLLTRHLDLKAFVLYSSPAATFGNPGQGNYAAANAFLDVLAQQRYRQGLPATAMGWGLWQVSAGTSGALTDTDVARVLRTGMALMPPEHGLAMLDAAVTLPYGVLSATPLNLQVLRKNAQQGILHPYLQRLVSAQVSRQGQGAEGFNRDLRKELSALEPSARSNHLRTLIEGFVCTVLGLDDQAQIPADQPFSDSGLDSLMALELRNRLSRATGLQLTATVIFDFPTPEVLTSYLGDQLFPDAEEVESTGDNDAQIRELISSIDVSSLRQAGLLDTLLALANTTSEPVEEPNPNGKHILTANADELIQLAMASAEETP